MATDASAVDEMMPNAGTPAFDMRLNWSGNSPSLAAARGISAQIMVQPLRAPRPEMMTTIAITLPHAVPPNIESIAAEYGALTVVSSWLGRMPKMATRDSM